MDKYIYDKNNSLWYERCGDYYLPCLTLPEQKSVGKWGRNTGHIFENINARSISAGCFQFRYNFLLTQ